MGVVRLACAGADHSLTVCVPLQAFSHWVCHRMVDNLYPGEWPRVVY